MANELKYAISPEGIGMLKISLWDDNYMWIENHTGVIDVRENCIKINAKGRVLSVKGEFLRITELDGCNLRIKGKIFATEYLT